MSRFLPRRIVCLVPSLSEILVEWGLREEIVGCTKFCIEPPDLQRTALNLGGTKDFSLAAIRDLQPTYVIANQEENPRDRIEDLQRDLKVLLTFPRGPEDVPSTLRELSIFLGCGAIAQPWISRLEELLGERKASETGPRFRFLYLIWRQPYMIAGPDTYISRLLEWAGWANAYQGALRYPSLSCEAMAELAPDRLLLSSEPYPFRRRDAARLREEWPEAPPMLKVDGRLFSWYGSKTEKALAELIRSAPEIPGQKLEV